MRTCLNSIFSNQSTKESNYFMKKPCYVLLPVIFHFIMSEACRVTCQEMKGHYEFLQNVMR